MAVAGFIVVAGLIVFAMRARLKGGGVLPLGSGGEVLRF